MIFTGQKIRKLTGQKDISFSLTDCFVNNLTGTGEFGFSGEGNSIKFKFERGNIFDFDNVNIYSYQENSKFSISGDISSTRYSYIIKDNLHSYEVRGRPKTNFKLNEFFVNTTNCSIDASVKILTDSISYNLQAPTEITKGASFNVTMFNQSTDATIYIFNIAIRGTSANYFSINSFTAPISILPGEATTIGVTNSVTLINSIALLLDIETNIGLISKLLPIELYEAPTYFTSNLLEKISEVVIPTGKEIVYKFSSSVYKNDARSLAYSGYINQISTISLEYEHGNIGQFHKVDSVIITNPGIGYQNPSIAFSSGITNDQLAAGTVQATSGNIDSVSITNSGNYFQAAPTLTFSDQDPSASGAIGASETTTYNKTFTNSFNIGTGINLDLIQVNFLSQGYTQNQGSTTYDYLNFGPGMYRTPSTENISRNHPYYIKIVYTDKDDEHPISVKLKINNLYKDSITNKTIEEETISIT